jgi:hypothetical protein
MWIPRYLSEGKKDRTLKRCFGLGNKRMDKLSRMRIDGYLSEGGKL